MTEISINILEEEENTTGDRVHPQRRCTISDKDYQKIFEIEPKVTYHHRKTNTYYVFVEGKISIPLGEQIFQFQSIKSDRKVLIYKGYTECIDGMDSIKLSELIEQLKLIQKEHGDISVGVREAADDIIRQPFRPTTVSVGILTVGSVYQDGNNEIICVL